MAIMKGETARTMAGSFDPNNPTYLINNRCYKTPLYTRTLAMDAQYHGGVLELDAHNLYGGLNALVLWSKCKQLLYTENYLKYNKYSKD